MSSQVVGEEEKPPTQPLPPLIRRRVRFYALQAIGMPILALIPVLGLFKLMDTTNSTLRARTGRMEATVEYPRKFRYRTVEPLAITLLNHGAKQEKVEVTIDRQYLENFTELEFHPEPDRIEREGFTWELKDMEMGQRREIKANFEAEVSGTHRGKVRIRPTTERAVEVPFETLVFP